MPRRTLQLRRFVAGDAALISPRPDMAAEAAVCGRELLAGGAPAGPAYTVTGDGAPVAIGGFMPIWPGRWCAWSLVDCSVTRREWALLTSFARSAVASVIGHAAGAGRPVRVEATSSRLEGCDWLPRLGFEAEGVLKAYGPDGADYALYARTWRP